MDGIHEKFITPLPVRACCNTATRAVVQTEGRVLTQALELTLSNREFYKTNGLYFMPYDLASSTCMRT